MSPPAPRGQPRGRSRGRLASFRKNHPVLVRALALGATLVVSFSIGLLYASWALVCRGGQCPAIEELDEYTPNQTSKLYAVDGRFIAEIGLERRTLVRLDEIPQVVKDAFVVTEDKRFYSHAGIDWYRVFGAAFYNLMSGGWRQGFSTITMQLARNIFPESISRDKTLVRKIKEGKVARGIENRFSKEKILELYLNQIDLGSGSYGVETASQRYFGKSVRDLNLAEAATLAALPKAPSRYNPRRYPERSIQRRNTVIELMRREEVISDADASLAKAYPLRLAERTESGDIAPYYVEWVRQQLDDQFGRQLYEQGLKVFTTLDLDMQSAAERALEQQLRAIESGRFGAFGKESYERYIARKIAGDETAPGNSPYLQAAFVALEPQSGAVRAMVGGRDFDDSKFNRAVQAKRQPGSTFKPFVYATAIKNGRPPSYIVMDTSINLANMGGSDWSPGNFDGRFEGAIPMRRGLYMSRNLATINLGMELGEERVIGEARNFGITSPIPPFPSIHIGAAEVFPLELISAYSAFANLGIRATPHAIVRVENARGEILWQPMPTHSQVMTAEEAWLMVDMMKDVVRRGTGSGVWASGFRRPAGGKTGTTNDGTDVWFVGYTADLVAGVWMGYDRPRKIKANAQGGILAAPAWTAFMQEVYRRKPAPPDWPRPPGIVVREVDLGSGLLASPYCGGGPVVTEFFISGTEPTRECMPAIYSPYYDTTGSIPPDPMPRPQPQPVRPVDPGTRVQPGTAPLPRLGQTRDTFSTRAAPPIPPVSRPGQLRDTLSIRRPGRDTVPAGRRPVIPELPSTQP